MIFLASPDEVKAHCFLGSNFFRLIFPDRGEFDPGPFSVHWASAVQSGIAFVLFRRDGDFLKEAMGVYVYAHPVFGTVEGNIGFWFVSEEKAGLSGGLLFNSAMRELASRGARYVTMSIPMGNDRFYKVQDFAVKAGFFALEMHFGKEIK